MSENSVVYHIVRATLSISEKIQLFKTVLSAGFGSSRFEKLDLGHVN